MKKLICAVTVLACLTAQANTIHVDVDCPGPGNGSEADPYCSIQTAIDNAVDTDEIVVAPGTYFETINFIGKAITLRSSNGPDVTTIDGTGFFHVVQCVSQEGPDTVLSGFVITGGNANGGDFPDNRGGGMFNDNSSPTVTNCIFSDNSAFSRGGGMYNANSSPTVTNCMFSANFAGSVGGAMFNNNSSPTVTNCMFIENHGNFTGGMENAFSSNPTVTDCTFSGNTTNHSGGGMFNEVNSSPTVINCIFSYNEGGMRNDGGNPTVTNCTFSSNVDSAMFNNNSSPAVTNCTFSSNVGSGMFNINSSPAVTNCTFSGNTAVNGGGGMHNSGGSPTVTNCSFSGNTAQFGGGMSNWFDSSPTVTTCTFSENTATDGGGIFSTDQFGGHSTPTVSNCILWDNSPNQIADFEGSTTTVRYCDVQGGWSGLGENNIDADPMFVDPVNGDFRLSPGSPCIDAGDNTAVPKFILRDLDGNPRFVADVCAGSGGAAVDMGAYEFQGTSCDLGTMLAMFAAWGRCNDCGDCQADLDGDCSVGILDLLILLGNWG